jgi:AraC-like DNA-binding protein
MPIGLVYRPFLEIARESLVDVDGLLGKAGLTESQLLDPGMRLSPDRSRELAAKLFALVGDPEIGLRAAERLRLSDVDLLGYLLRHSPHALAALEQLARHIQLMGDTAYGRLERKGGRIAVIFALCDGRALLSEAADFSVAAVFRFIGRLSGDRARPTEVHIPRPRPRRPSAYRMFFGCPVLFGTVSAQLHYDESSLTAPFAEGDSRLVAILEGQAAEVLSTLPRVGTVVERVRAQVRRQLEHGTAGGLEATAAEFRMSVRTLRRRLRQAGTSYRSVLDQARRERGVALVEEGDQTLAAIAQRVGFADTTAFARAFRRWTGVAPRVYRVR